MNSSSPWTVLALIALAGSAIGQIDCGAIASSELIGPGTPGSVGVPELEQIGWPAVGGRFGLRMVDAPPLAPGLLVVSTSLAPLPWPTFAATSYPALPGVSQAFTTNLLGRTGVLLEIDPVPAALCGFEAIGQAIVVDGAATGGVAFSPGRRAVFGEVPQPALPQRVLIDTAEDVVWIDVDKDGRVDLITSEAQNPFQITQHVLTLHLNRGAGDFEAVESWTVAGYLDNRLLSGDLDGDGTLDLVSHNLANNRPRSLLGLGESFQPPVPSLGSGQTVFDPVLVDFDRDGHLDLVALGAHFAEGNTVALGLGDGTFTPPSQFDIGLYATDLIVEDLDQDGLDELVMIKTTEVLVLDAPPGATMAVVQALPKSTEARVGACGDIDGDGFGDLVLVDPDEVEIFAGSVAGGLAPSSTHSVEGADAGFLGLIDLDDDGTPEVVALNREVLYPSLASDQREVIVLRQSESGFEQLGSFGARLDAVSFEWLDVDSDGAPELAVLGTWFPGDLTLLEWRSGEGRFHSALDLETSSGELLDAVLADLDMDGAVDLVTARGSDLQAAEVLLGQGNGEFTSTYFTGGPISTSQVEIGDFDLDGIPDLFALSTAYHGFGVLIGNGDGTFGPHLGFATNIIHPKRVRQADIDSDGRTDVLFFGPTDSPFSYDDVVQIRFGTPGFLFGPTYQPNLEYVPSPCPDIVDVVPFDANDDGHIDLVVARECRLELYPGNGTGVFFPPTVLPLDGSELLAADLDLDGDLDLIGVETLAPLENLGAGLFVAHPALDPGGVGDRSVVAADVTGDARPELLWSPPGTHGVELIMTGDGFEWVSAGRFATAEPAEFLRSADADGQSGAEVLTFSEEVHQVLPSRK